MKFAKLVAFLPITSSMRGNLYRLNKNNKIGKNFRTGFGSYVESAKIDIADDVSIGNQVKILCSHYFDVVAPITIEDKVTIAGKWIQIYTHSFDVTGNRLDGEIYIGKNVYIGAGCIINLGVTILVKAVCIPAMD
jgi:acetyltransferase-like isoleucine patch superfamily enzyme